MFEGLSSRTVTTSDTEIFLRMGGSGPPLLMLHGYPQTHVMWHRIAPFLQQHFTLVLPDLRGYGDSGKPPSDDVHLPYSKRAMARDMAEVMTALGFEQFYVVGHDRGARVAHRLALDFPARVSRLAVLDVVPTRTLFQNVNRWVAQGYFHWFFMTLAKPYPETFIGNSVDAWLEMIFGHCDVGQPTAEARAEYRRCFTPAMIAATCEDFRAGASVDLEHDEADIDRPIACPTLALWGDKGLIAYMFDVLGTWKERAVQATGRVMPGSHFFPEECPEATAQELIAFFG